VIALALGAAQRNRPPAILLFGMAVLSIIVALAVIGIWYAPYDPTAFAVRFRLEPPSFAHPLGTDEFGRDVLSRVLAGAHLSLAIGFGAMLISLVIGVPLGLFAAFHRGIVETAIMRAVDLMISLPPVLLGLLILAVTPPSLGKTIIVVGLGYIPILVRLSRAVGLGLLEEDFVQAAFARGEGAVPILWHEILPNAWPPIIVECGLRVTFAILLGSALSFLGLGPQPPSSEWGLMISESREFLTQAPWVGIAPGLCLSVLLVSVNLVGEGLREYLDPHLSGRTHGDGARLDA
jgi:peptide/nickel transport system permease protein